MLQIRYDVQDLDAFVLRQTGGAAISVEERDRTIAAKYPTLDEIWFAGELFGKLWMGTTTARMEAYAYGATAVLIELRRGVEVLGAGSASFDAAYMGGGYGVGLRLERTQGQLRAIRRASGEPLQGPSSVEVPWDEFTRAVDAYEVWYHTEYLAIASWLLLVEDVQQMRRDAGYPVDRL